MKNKVTIDKHELILTNQDKVFWPGRKYTKGDMVDYYRKMTKYILPYLKDRPESLHRFPDGIKGESFFHKNIDEGSVPSWIRTYKLSAESKKEKVNYLICDDEATLAYLANWGTIEMNPWSSSIGDLDRPDYLAFDLDPVDVGFSKLIDVALEIKKLLDKVGVKGYCKTSGKRGLHIFVPTGAKYSYDQAEKFVKIMALIINKKLPKLVSLEHDLDKRKGRVHIDYLQNARGKTMVSVYSLRPTSQATVSVPVSWEELKKGVKPTDFRMDNIFDRLKKKGDLFKGVLGKGIDLEKCLYRLEQIWER